MVELAKANRTPRMDRQIKAIRVLRRIKLRNVKRPKIVARTTNKTKRNRPRPKMLKDGSNTPL